MSKIYIWICGCAHTAASGEGPAGIYPIRTALPDLEYDPHAVFYLGDFGAQQGFWTENIEYCEYDIEQIRDKLYIIPGNHDAGDESMVYYRRLADPIIEHPNKPYAITGDWEKFEITIGNAHFLFIADRNDVVPNAGMGGITPTGAYPAGAVAGATKTWVETQAASYANLPVFVLSHQALQDTVIGTESVAAGLVFHGSTGGGRSACVWYDSDDSTELGSWTVTNITVENYFDDRGGVEVVSSVTHWKAGQLTLNHGTKKDKISSMLVLEENSRIATIQFYNHAGGTSSYPVGIFLERYITLPVAFSLS